LGADQAGTKLAMRRQATIAATLLARVNMGRL
jgi:hypothetical protein